MSELPKRTPTQSAVITEERYAPVTNWEPPRAEDMVIAGDEKQITRMANEAYAANKAVRSRFDNEERQAEIDELEAIYNAPSVSHPGPETAKDREIEGIWASWTASPAEQAKPEAARVSRLRKFAKSVFRIG